MTVTISPRNTGFLGFLGLGIGYLGLDSAITGTGYIDAQYLPKNFTIRRAFEGPQIIISWDPPDSSLYASGYEVVLERRTLDWSYVAGDAEEIYSGTLTDSHTLSDYSPSIKEGYSYYYTLFIKLPTALDGYTGDDAGLYVTDTILQKSETAFSTGYFNQKLYALLPLLYKKADSFDSLSEDVKPLEKLISQIGTDDLLAEKFNFKEDQGKEYGPLYRFLKIAGINFDEIRSLIANMTNVMDVDSCDQKFLHILASNAALKFKRGLNVTRRRADLRNIGHFYKWRGTGEGIISRASAISTSNLIYVKEYNENSFLTNYADRLTAANYIPVGITLKANTLRTDTLDDTSLTGSQTKGFIINGFNGDADLTANKFTVAGSSSQNASQVSFAEIGTTFGITDLKPYERMDAPGKYTVEGKIKVLKWPKPPSSAGISSVNVIKRTIEISTTATFTFNVRLNTVRLAGSDQILHRLALYVGTGAGTWIPVQLKEEAGQIDLNEEVHFAFSRDTDNSPNPLYSLYRNGVLIETDSSVAYTIPDYSDLANGSGIIIGSSANGELRDAAFVLDEVRIWDTVRSASEISSNYNQPINGHSSGLVLYFSSDFLKSTTAYETSKFGNNGTLAKETRGSYPQYANDLISSIPDDYVWAKVQHQKFYADDPEYYVTGDPVCVNGVRFHVIVDNSDIIYPEVTV